MKASELPLRPDGSIYHLAMQPGEASHRCLLVGDPGRVAMSEPLFARILHRRSNREFTWITGLYKDTLITVIGTGIGADNTEIALIELDAIHNIDLSRGIPFPTQKKLYLLRIGTSGLLQEDVSLGTAVFSEWAIGVDSLPFFYDEASEKELERTFTEYWHKRTGASLPWYATRASEFFCQRAQETIKELPWTQGITYSAPGFFAPQGRSVRLRARFAELPQVLGSFSYAGVKIQNIEMEVAPLYYLARLLGHEAGAICLGVAHRQRGEFVYRDGGFSPEEAMRRLLQLGLDWLRLAP
ncbi:MAG: phosphorylase [Bacteroidia bacterium]|nr:phosphorylase [Bacteroidia bacterium]MDW8014955.1 phosphorylase [Bacteroidia bacterium]